MNITYSRTKAAALSGVTPVSNAFIMEYMVKAPENYVKVYLYALMQEQMPLLANEDISLALSIDEKTVTAAFEHWQNLGLLRILRAEPLHIELSSPALAVQPQFSMSSAKYADLLCALREVLGTRILSSAELKMVYDWLEVFGLSEDVVIMLIAYCIDLKGSRVHVRYMDAVAKSWADMCIFTAEDAKRHIEEQRETFMQAREIKKRWRLARAITDDEMRLYKKWRFVWNIPHDVIMEACADTVAASNPSFGYLDGILEGYRERGTVDMDSVSEYRKKRMLLDENARQIFERAGIKRKPTLQQRDKIDNWLGEWHIPLEALMLLAETAAPYSRPFDYIARVAASWNEQNIRNVEAAKSDLMARTVKKTNKPVAPKEKPERYNYPQRKYTEDDLKRLGIDLTGGAN